MEIPLSARKTALLGMTPRVKVKTEPLLELERDSAELYFRN
jgi:hypothetical protein